MKKKGLTIGVVIIIFLLVMGASAWAECFEIHRADGWIEKYQNWPDPVILGSGESLVFLWEYPYEAVANLAEYKRASSWATIKPAFPEGDIKWIEFKMNEASPQKIISFLRINEQDYYILALFPLKQEDMKVGTFFRLQIKNVGKKSMQFFVGDLRNLCNIYKGWEEFYGDSIVKYKVIKVVK